MVNGEKRRIKTFSKEVLYSNAVRYRYDCNSEGSRISFYFTTFI